MALLGCAINISEGRDANVLGDLAAASGDALLDVHVDAEHHRSVFTLLVDDGGAAVRRLIGLALERLSLTDHEGLHPRVGVLDVVPFVPFLPDAPLAALADARLDAAVAARDATGAFVAETYGVPCFAYGPLADGTDRSLPEIRRHAFTALAPDWGPPSPHPRAGAVCVGARRALVAYNLVLSSEDLAIGRRVAAAVRAPEVRTLAFPLSVGVQVSCNLVAPWRFGPAEVADAVAAEAGKSGVEVVSAELVGLVPRAVLEAVPLERWGELDLGPTRTLEARCRALTAKRSGLATTRRSPPPA